MQNAQSTELLLCAHAQLVDEILLNECFFFKQKTAYEI
mgnify:CR=1 FL=1